ncbi:145_t:CDS:2, partial [Racocetra fulgida]
MLTISCLIGVNKGGECNVDNVTHYSATQDDNQKKFFFFVNGSGYIYILGDEAAFYNTFWSLQTYFSNPPKLFKDNNLEVVLNNIGIVLNRFSDIIAREKLKTAEENLGGIRNNDFEYGLPSPPSDDGRGKKRKFMETDEEESITFSKDYVKYFPKYLSSFALFDKEYLTGFFPEEQARINKAKAPHDTAAVQLPTYTIMEPQQHMVQEIWSKIIGQLEETTPNGKNFVRTILHILNMEKRWNYWKFADNCSFGSDKETKDKAERAREDFAEALKRKAKMNKPMEPFEHKSNKLSEFWTRKDNVNDDEFMADASRKIIPPDFYTVYERIRQDGYPVSYKIGFTLDPSDTVEEKEIKEKCWVINHFYVWNDAKLKNAKEDEEKKDDVEALKMLIDENPTC